MFLDCIFFGCIFQSLGRGKEQFLEFQDGSCVDECHSVDKAGGQLKHLPQPWELADLWPQGHVSCSTLFATEVRITPPKTNGWNLKHIPLEQEKHLSVQTTDLQFLGSMLIFRGVYERIHQVHFLFLWSMFSCTNEADVKASASVEGVIHVKLSSASSPVKLACFRTKHN